MSKGKKWRHQEDLILIEIIIDHISKGITISEAFPVISEKLVGRTIDAVSGRWYSYLSDIYGEAIKEAEKKQKENALNIVQSILNNQGPVEVKFIAPSVEPIVMPTTSSAEEDFNFTPPAFLDNNPLNAESVISFITSLNNRVTVLQKENMDLFDELELSLEETERLKVEIVELKELNTQDPELERKLKEHTILVSILDKCRKMAI